MSLILEALKKIEREKGTAAPRVVVVGPVPWGGHHPRRRAPLVLGAALALAVAGLGAWWLLLRPGGAPAPAAADASPRPIAPTEPPATGQPVGAALPVPAASSAATPAAVAPAPTPTRAEPTTFASPSRPAAEPAQSPPQMQPPARTAAAPPVPPRAAAAPSAPAAAAVVPELRLTAISRRDGQAIALVNDRLVREGDSFDGVRIVRIGEAEVEVEVRGQRHVLRF